MSIRVQLPLTFIICLLALFAISALSLIEMDQLHTVAVEANEVSLPALAQAGQIQATALRHRAAMAELRAAGDQAGLDAELTRAADEIEAQLGRYRAIAGGEGPAALIEEVAVAWQGYLDLARAAPLSPSASVASQLDTLDAGLASFASAVRTRADGHMAGISATYDAARTAVLAISALSLMFALTAGVPIALDLARDLARLTATTTAVAENKLDQRVVSEGSNELGRLGAAFNLMLERLRASRDEVAARQSALEQRNSDLEQAFTDLRSAVAAHERLSESIRALSCPVVAVAQGVLVMPLIGVIDEQRSDLIVQTLLAAIERERAHAVIIDTTGVPVIDGAVAAGLMRAASAARLLGARPVLTGIRPELAQTIVGLGLDLSQLTTRADLREGLAAIQAR